MNGGRAAFRAPADFSALRVLIDKLLRAYELDRNPAHVLSAWRELRDAGMQPTEVMFSYLDRALADVRPRLRRGHKHGRAGFSLRDVELMDVLNELTGDRGIPAALPAGLKARIAERFNLNRDVVTTAFSRLRKRHLLGGALSSRAPREVSLA